MPNFQIRKATPEDTPTIFNLIYKLAVYEKLENDVITTVEELRTNIFEKKLRRGNHCRGRRKTCWFCTLFSQFFYVCWQTWYLFRRPFCRTRNARKRLWKSTFSRIVKNRQRKKLWKIRVECSRLEHPFHRIL